MYLKSITIKGFKSFADRTRLDFGPGTSVIVGPNGSGKSNVTDAVLWALGEQSPVAVRGHSMQDVIFGGAPGRQAASSATVELVLDDSEGVLGLGPEVSIMRRLERSGEGEYRIGGARCRLIDLIEVLSDTGLGKEMHSVVSQGRIEAIVTSKPRDRRLLIEEAAGLGKHRKRRRRAQLKLGHTQDNLDRALDVEREARSRLKPLKRQAEAAELHERVHRQMLEVRWELAREDLRARGAELREATEQALGARASRGEIEAELDAVARRRRAAEEVLSERSSAREELSRRSYAAQTAADRVGYRADAVSEAGRTVSARLARARAELVQLAETAQADRPEPLVEQRIAALEREAEALELDRAAELARQLAELERAVEAADRVQAERAESVEVAAQARVAAEAAYEQAQLKVREAERAVEAARRESARVGGELAAVNQFLRSHGSTPGGARSLADALTVEGGYELAVAAALDGRLGAALLEDRGSAGALLDQSGRDGGRALVLGGARGGAAAAFAAPTPEAVALADHISGEDAVADLARRLLSGVWIVDDVDQVSDDFPGVAVTRQGRVFVPATGELRQAPKVGEERVLAERNRREQLIAATEAAVGAEHGARAGVEHAAAAAAALEAERERAVSSHRDAVRAHDEAAEERRRLAAAIERRRGAPDEGPGADRLAQLRLQLDGERDRLARAGRERAQRDQRIARLRAEIEHDERLVPAIASVQAALRELAAAIAQRRAGFDEELARDREAGEQVAAELRACAQAEAGIQARLHAAAEALTAAEVRAQRARDQEAEAQGTLGALAVELGLEPEAAAEAMEAAHREELSLRLERLKRRREQIGPVNPLAQDEYNEAVAHIEELEAQRGDLESALRELEGLIRDTDREIRETFEETFAAAAEHFEELVARVFPGGRGRLRLVSEHESPAAVIGGQAPDGSDGEEAAATEEGAGEAAEEDLLGVEIEITPAGKSMKRLSLLSGGEKSMTALAFMFAVFLAKPCPFYVMDEVEAALDDLNITRFLDLLETYSDRAQFIVVTHQKRTMEAATSLYGVAMGGDGVSKVISRRLPAREAA